MSHEFLSQYKESNGELQPHLHTPLPLELFSLFRVIQSEFCSFKPEIIKVRQQHLLQRLLGINVDSQLHFIQIQ